MNTIGVARNNTPSTSAVYSGQINMEDHGNTDWEPIHNWYTCLNHNNVKLHMTKNNYYNKLKINSKKQITMAELNII